MNSLTPWWAYSFMMCHRIGRPPISTIGLGRMVVSSLSRVPRPPARITSFTKSTSEAGFDCFVSAGIESCVHCVSRAPEGKVLMAEVACHYRDKGEDSSSEIGGCLRGAEPAAQQ